MRAQILVLMLGAVVLTACGTTHRTTVVVPEGSSAVVVPSDGHDTKVITNP